MEDRKMRVTAMSVDQLELFFRLIKEFVENQGYKDTKQLRLAILDEMQRQGKVQYVYETERDLDTFIKDQAKHYKVALAGFEVKHGHRTGPCSNDDCIVIPTNTKPDEGNVL